MSQCTYIHTTIFMKIWTSTKNLIIGVIIGILLSTTVSYAYRFNKPTKLTQFDDSALITLNEALEQIWNLSNGRFSLDIVTTNPDGNTKGDIGDMLLFNNSGTYYLEINTTGAKVWRGVQLTDTP